MLHLCQFRRAGRAIVAQHRLPHLGGAHISAEVDRRPILFQAAKIAVEGCPAHLKVIVDEEGLHRRERALVLGSNRATLPRDFRRDSLGQLAERTMVNQQRRLRLAKHVDESRRHRQAGRVNNLPGHYAAEIADGHNTVAPHCNIAAIWPNR